jgi:hypothetical protein
MAKNTPLTNDPAPPQPASADVGMELLCANFEGGITVAAKVIGRDERWVRVRIEELDRDWLVRPERLDLAKGTWEHVAADYPAAAEDKEFDALYRPAKIVKEDPVRAKKIAEAAAALKNLLPDGLKSSVDDLAQGATDRFVGGPAGSVLARWKGKGKLDAPFVERKTRETKRGATTGTEGWFARPTVQKFAAHFEQL